VTIAAIAKENKIDSSIINRNNLRIVTPQKSVIHTFPRLLSDILASFKSICTSPPQL
jgi:hypothetical protein